MQHYFELGVEYFHISIHVASDDLIPKQRIDIQRCQEIISQYPARFEGVVVFPADSRILRQYHNHIQRKVSPRDWILWVDSDEFHQYPTSLPDFLSLCDQRQDNVVGGVLLDRVTRDGTLPQLDPSRSVWDQFPLGCNFTERVLKGLTRKIPCAKANVQVGIGNHVPERAGRLRWAAEQITIHHFKWTRDVIDRLQLRVDDESRRTKPWWLESERALKHLSADLRIDLTSSDLTVQPAWPGPPHRA